MARYKIKIQVYNNPIGFFLIECLKGRFTVLDEGVSRISQSWEVRTAHVYGSKTAVESFWRSVRADTTNVIVKFEYV